MLKTISNRVSVLEKEEGLSLVIKADYDQNKQNMLMVWILAWTIGGIAIFFQTILGDLSRETKIYLMVWMAFWAYFEYLTVLAFFWHKKGIEKILFKSDRFIYRRGIFGIGKPEECYYDLVKNIQLIEFNEKSIIAFLSLSYWQISGETIQFDYQSKRYKFGYNLNKNEQIEISKLLKKYCK